MRPNLSSPFPPNPLHTRHLKLPIISALRRILESMVTGSALFSLANLSAIHSASAPLPTPPSPPIPPPNQSSENNVRKNLGCFARYSTCNSFRINKTVSSRPSKCTKLLRIYAPQPICFQRITGAFWTFRLSLSIHLNSLGLLIAGKIRIAQKSLTRDHELHDRNFDRNSTTRLRRTIV
jgi:hypothetical protein